MSLSIILFQNTKLSNKYFNVFKDQTSLATYLGTCPHLEVYNGDDVYFTNNGSISIDNSSLLGHVGDKYNYMQFSVYYPGSGTYIKRYAFINDITIVNGTCIINYNEDIWHTYAISESNHKINLYNSLLEQTKQLNAGSDLTITQINALPKLMPIQLEGQNPPRFKVLTYPKSDDHFCYVVAVASMYKLAGGDKVNERMMSCYLLSIKESATGGLTPLHGGKQYSFDIDFQLPDILTWLKAKSSDTQIHNHVIDEMGWNYDIEKFVLIPSSIGDQLFENVLSGDETHDYGLHQDFELSGYYYNDFTSTQDAYAQFNTEIGFNNLIVPTYSRYMDNNGHTKFTFNGFNIEDRIEIEKEFETGYDCIALGNISRVIPITFNGLNKKAKFEFIFNTSDFAIRFLFDNTIIDITGDLTYRIPISTQSADITQQQRIALQSGNIVSMLGMVGSTIGLGASIGSAIATHGGSLGTNKGSSIAGMVNQGLNIISAGVQLDARNQAQYVKNHLINVDDASITNCVLGGIREIIMNYDNITIVNKMIQEYGYIYRVILNNFDTVYSSNNYIKFSIANVYGSFSQEIAKQIETILENGVILN